MLSQQRPLPRRRPASCRRDGDHMLVHDTQSRLDHRLNASAYALWELCDGATGVEEMVEAVRVMCGLQPHAARADVLTGLEALTTSGLVDWPGDTAP